MGIYGALAELAQIQRATPNWPRLCYIAYTLNFCADAIAVDPDHRAAQRAYNLNVFVVQHDTAIKYGIYTH